MMIYFGCPKCGAAMQAPDSQADKSEECPECGNYATVPMQQSPAPPATNQDGPPPDLLDELQAVSDDPSEEYRARPRHRSATASRSRRSHVTIEKTSKDIKSRQFISGMLWIIGIILIIVGFLKQADPIGIIGTIILVIGIIWSIVLAIKAWWHHG